MFPLVDDKRIAGNIGSASIRAGSLRPNVVAVLALICGALAPIKLAVVGDLFAPELMLPLVALIAGLSANGGRVIREPIFLAFLLAGFASLLGYVLSDLIQGSRPDQFLRGWGRVALVVSDFVCLAVILGQDRRNLWWFSLGSGLGAILFLWLVEGMPLAHWKVGYADPVVQTSAALGAFLPAQISSLWIGGLGVFSVLSDFRSFAAICLAVAAMIWLRVGKRERSGSITRATVKVGMAGGVVLIVLSNLLSMTQDGSSSRRGASDAGRQAAFETGLEAISRSPLIGHGSWSENRESAKAYRKRADQLREAKGMESPKPQSGRIGFNPHSQILHAWYEGGILGAAFFIVMLVQIVRQGRWLLTGRRFDALTPLLLYLLLVTTWNFFMSPFGAGHRLGIAMGAALLVMLGIERRQVEAHMRAGASVLERPAGSVVAAPVGRRLRPAQRRLRWLQPSRPVMTKRIPT